MYNKKHNRRVSLIVQMVSMLAIVLIAAPAMAHCDSEDGPIIPAIRTALIDGNITPLLKWISPDDEAQIVGLFGDVRALRTRSDQARKIADQLFIETFIRVHRAAEGAPYTGLKPAGSAPPIIKTADRVLESGEIEKLADELTGEVRKALVERFQHAVELSRHQDDSVAAGREFVEAYVSYVHFVEGLHEFLNASGGHAHSESGEVDNHNAEKRSQGMKHIQLDETVGAIVAEEPQLSRVFEDFGIDYCCGGKIQLGEACRRNDLDPHKVLTRLEEARGSVASGRVPVDVAVMSLTDLANHIETTHHAYVKAESPRLLAMAQKVASVHGEHDHRLAAVRDTMSALLGELSGHMMKEEQILFPMIRQFAAQPSQTADSAAMIAGPINQMEAEHNMAGANLQLLTELTDGYKAPEWACNTYRAFLDGLRQFENDLHQHIHKENNVLFPRAMNGELVGRAN